MKLLMLLYYLERCTYVCIYVYLNRVLLCISEHTGEWHIVLSKKCLGLHLAPLKCYIVAYRHPCPIFFLLWIRSHTSVWASDIKTLELGTNGNLSFSDEIIYEIVYWTNQYVYFLQGKSISKVNSRFSLLNIKSNLIRKLP